MYILPPPISKKIEGYRWQSFTPPAAGKSRRFRGLICHRRSQKPDSPLWGVLQQQIDRTEDPEKRKELSEAKDSIREGEYDEDALPYRTLDQIEKFADSKDGLRDLMRAAQLAGAAGGMVPHPVAKVPGKIVGGVVETAGKVGEKIINDKIKLVERELENRIEDLDPKKDADRIGRIQSILKRLRSSPIERMIDK